MKFLKPTKILDTVYKVGGSFHTHPFDCTVYLIWDGKEGILIDCGTGAGYKKLKQNLEHVGCTADKINLVIGTHCHYDHLHAIGCLKRDNNAIRLAMHEEDAAAIEEGDSEKTCASWMFDDEAIPEKVDIILKEDERIKIGEDELKIIHTPGHSPGSICIELITEGKKVLFTGDAVNPSSERVGFDEDCWKETIRFILEEDVDILLSGHETIGNSLMHKIIAANRKLTQKHIFSDGLSSQINSVIQNHVMLKFIKNIEMFTYNNFLPLSVKFTKNFIFPIYKM